MSEQVQVRERNTELKPTAQAGQAVLLHLLDWIEQVAASGTQPVVVFDLDSTLYHTDQRHLTIFSEFIEHHHPNDPVLRAAFHELGKNGYIWSPMHELRRLQIGDDALVHALSQYWRERFFSNEYLRHDLPVDGAPEYVRACHDRGAFCYYLTGRTRSLMEEGTRASLYRHGFPMDSRTYLHMKQKKTDDDLQFKLDAATPLRALGQVLGIFENEPANLNGLSEAFPEALAVFLDTICMPLAPPLAPHVVKIQSFELSEWVGLRP